MSIRPADILTIAPIVTYSPTTPYNAVGDNIPFDSIDIRHNWFNEMFTKGSIITVGTSITSGLSSYAVVALNLDNNSITSITSSYTVLANNEVPAMITTIVGTGSNNNYLSGTTYYYYCMLQSKMVDIPTSSFVATGAEIGCPIYYNYTSEQFEWTSRTATSAPTGDIVKNYKNKTIPLGNIVAIVSYNSTNYYTVKFGSQEGFGTGLDAPIIGSVYHSILSDIVAQYSNSPSTYESDHYLYANKYITPTISAPSFTTISGVSGLDATIDNTGKTYTITNVSSANSILNDCYFWLIPISTTDLSGNLFIYKSDLESSGVIVSNAFSVTGTIAATSDISVELTSNNEITITFSASSDVTTPASDPQLYVLENLNSYLVANDVTGFILPSTASTNELTFSVTQEEIEGTNEENLKNTQFILVNTTVTSGTDYNGVILYHYNPITTQWDTVLTSGWEFFQSTSSGDIDYCSTVIATSSTSHDFTLTFGDSATVSASTTVTFITYETPTFANDVGKLLEYVYIDSTYGYYQLSHNSTYGQPLGIITEVNNTYASPYILSLLVEGIWDSSVTGNGGTIGGMGVDLEIDGSPTQGQDLWDNGHTGANYGHLHPSMDLVASDITKQKRIGFYLDATKTLITIYNNNDFSSYLDEIEADTTTINDATVQIYPKWVRTGIVYGTGGATGDLQTDNFDNRKIDTMAQISINPIGEDENEDVFLAVSEAIPTQSTGWTAPVYTSSTKMADSASNYWSSISGTLASITFDDANKVLVIEGAGTTKIEPFLGVYQTQVVTSSYDTINTSATTSGQVWSTQFKHSLPYCGIIVLAHTDSSVADNNRMMLFSYKGYSGYGTNKFAFYNVNIFKKISADGGTFIDTNWVGSNPGYYPKDYYDSTSSYYQKYLTSKKPNWTTSSAGLWSSTNSSGWAFKLMYCGGFKLNIVGGGTFSDVQLLPPDTGIDVNLNNRKCKFPPSGSKLRTPTQFDNANASTNDTTGRNFWASINTSLSLSTFAKASLAAKYNYIDIYNNTSKILSYSDLYTYDDLIGSIGIPRGMIFNTNGTTYTTSSTPTVIWIDPKEIWLDINVFETAPPTAGLAFIKIANKTYSTFTDLIDDNSMVEVTMGQNIFSDPENYSINNILDFAQIGYNQYPALMDGESVRFYLKNRKVDW